MVRREKGIPLSKRGKGKLGKGHRTCSGTYKSPVLHRRAADTEKGPPYCSLLPATHGIITFTALTVKMLSQKDQNSPQF